jgi:hypothetical protein
MVGLSIPVRLNHASATCAVLQPPSQSWVGFGLFPVRSPLLRESRLISVPPGTEMFHFPGFALPTYVFSRQ